MLNIICKGMSSLPREFRLCYASNIVWFLISGLVVIESVLHPPRDYLFLARYVLALVSSSLSAFSIAWKPSRFLGRLSVAVYAPFILIQLIEVWIERECGFGVERYWGVDCSSLVIYPADSRFLQVLVDQLAEFVLGLGNLLLLWECHVKKGHILYDTKRFKKALREPFLSARIQDEYASAEEGDSPGRGVLKVLISLLNRY